VRNQGYRRAKKARSSNTLTPQRHNIRRRRTIAFDPRPPERFADLADFSPANAGITQRSIVERGEHGALVLPLAPDRQIERVRSRLAKHRSDADRATEICWEMGADAKVRI